MSMDGTPVIEVEGVVTRFGAQTVHDGVSFQVAPGSLVALIGGSGTGKSVLLREMIGLQRPSAGRVRYSVLRLGWEALRRGWPAFQPPELLRVLHHTTAVYA